MSSLCLLMVVSWKAYLSWCSLSEVLERVRVTQRGEKMTPELLAWEKRRKDLERLLNTKDLEIARLIFCIGFVEGQTHEMLNGE